MSYPLSYLPTATAQAMLQDLKFRLPALSLQVVLGQDSSGWPTLTVLPAAGTAWTSGQSYAVIRIETVPTINQDVFGNVDAVFAPMQIQMAVEGNTTGSGAFPAASNTNDVLPFQVELTLLGELLQPGALVQIYNSQAGVQPSTALMTSANLVATWNNLQYPLTGSR